MSRHTRPLEGATVMQSHEAIVPMGPWKDATARVRLYDGLASAGYRTDYNAVPKRWVTLLVLATDGKVLARECWSYTGKRWDKAHADYCRIVGDMTREFAAVVFHISQTDPINGAVQS